MTYACHGYDRVIRGLSNYYKENPKVKVCFHIVGKGDEIPKLKSLTKQLHMDKYVFLRAFRQVKILKNICEFRYCNKFFRYSSYWIEV